MPTPPERMYTFHINWAQYDFVIQALMEMPWRSANPILQNLNVQRVMQDEKYAKAEQLVEPKEAQDVKVSSK